MTLSLLLLLLFFFNPWYFIPKGVEINKLCKKYLGVFRPDGEVVVVKRMYQGNGIEALQSN